jgi:hypothetical protein
MLICRTSKVRQILCLMTIDEISIKEKHPKYLKSIENQWILFRPHKIFLINR